MSAPGSTPTFVTSDKVIIGGSAVLCVISGLAHYGGWSATVAFVFSAAAVALLASLVGRSVDQLGDRFGAGATGVLQSALGNLPELFICIFALRAGLVDVVRAALVGSILANLLLVLGLAFVVGGLRHGTQQLGSDRARTIIVLLVLSVTAMAIPSFTHWLHTGGQRARADLSRCWSRSCCWSLFGLSLPFSLRKDAAESSGERERRGAAALAGDARGRHARGRRASWLRSSPTGSSTPSSPRWTPCTINQTFAGLVVVAIAGNAVENVVGVQLAAKNQARSTPSRSSSTARSRSRWCSLPCW